MHYEVVAMPTKIDVDSWSTQLRKGLAELCVLAAVRSLGEAYGYQLVQFLQNHNGLQLTESTVYPLLARLSREGCLSVTSVPSPSGPPRRYYRLHRQRQSRARSDARRVGQCCPERSEYYTVRTSQGACVMTDYESASSAGSDSTVGADQIAAYIDSVEKVLMSAAVPAYERLQILGDLETQITEMLNSEPPPFPSPQSPPSSRGSNHRATSLPPVLASRNSLPLLRSFHQHCVTAPGFSQRSGAARHSS